MAYEWAQTGVKCVCINDKQRHGYCLKEPLQIGKVYTIALLIPSHITGEPAALFTDTNKGVPLRLSRFRPLVTKTMDQDLEQFNHLLNPSPLEKLDRLAELLDLGY